MARKTPTKQQRINRQYREQIRRIERAYRSIEISGGRFSQTVSEIIRPVKKPTEATIRRLRSITKNDLYRKARTETGESGWSIRTHKLQMASWKGQITKHKTKLARELYGHYYDTYTEKEKKQAREEAYDRWRYDVDRRYNEIVKYSQDTPDYEPSALPDNNYIEDITDRPTIHYTEDTSYTTGDDEAFYFALDDVIETLLSENQDKSFAKALFNEYEDLKGRLTSEQFLDWLRKNGQEFSKLVQEVMEYRPSVLYKGDNLNKFNQAMNKLNDGVTPLEKFDSYYDTGEQGYDDFDDIQEESSAYYDEDEEPEEFNDGFVDLLDTINGNIIKGKLITYLSRTDKYGKNYYDTRWVDENGLTLDVGYKRSHYVPISQIRNIEDYL